jgi:nicotinamide-nucleotide amidase
MPSSRAPSRGAAITGDVVGRHRVAVAESCTGGLVAQALAAVEGSGEWFLGGVVAYHREVKAALLGVDPVDVVNERTAIDMAAGVAELTGASATIGLTGAAGPDPLDGAEPGTVVVATYVDGDVEVTTHHLEGEPEDVCAQARDLAVVALGTALRAHGCAR